MHSVASTPEVDQCRQLLNQVTSQVEHTLKAGDPGSVHDLRVSIRRLRQALVVFFPKKAPKKLRNRLRTMMVFAGEVRDCDITMKLLGKSKLAGVAALRSDCRRKREGAWLTLTGSLKDWLGQPHRIPTSRGVSEETAIQVLPAAAKDFFRRGIAAANGASAKELHKFRIAGKKFRYTLELFGSSLRPWRVKIETIQTLLGRINDYVTARRVAEGLGGGKKLDAEFEKKQKKRIRDFHDYWTRDLARKWRHELRVELRKPILLESRSLKNVRTPAPSRSRL